MRSSSLRSRAVAVGASHTLCKSAPSASRRRRSFCAEHSRSFAFAPGELGFGPLELAQALLRFALEAAGDEAVLSIDSAITAFGTLCLVPGTLGGEPALGERIVAIGLEEYLTAYLDDGGLRGDPKGPRRWRTMPRRARHSFTIAGAMTSARTKSSGSPSRKPIS
jgi:hypothetical protein